MAKEHIGNPGKLSPSPKEEGGIEFRNLVDFNRALIAKQVWRLLVNPNSLATTILKSRYFKHTNILEAELGNNPSFVWRSILWGREVIKAGLGWKINNGKNIHIFRELWVKGLPFGRIISRIATGLMLDRFINDEGQRNERLIQEGFYNFEAEEILKMNFGNILEEDARIWREDSKGVYTTKLGYYVARRLRLKEEGKKLPETSSKDVDKNWWNMIWKAKIPPKVRIFAWKASINAIATEENMHLHHILISPICRACGKKLASESHCIFFCKKVKHIWESLSVSDEVRGMEMAPFKDIILKIRRNKNHSLETLITHAWAIWRERCKAVHMGNFSQTKERFTIEVPWVEHLIEDFQLLRKINPGCFGKLKGWQESGVKEKTTLFTDAGFERNGELATCGFVVIGEGNNILAAGCNKLKGMSSSTEAELMAVLEGTTYCENKNIEISTIKTDNMEVVELLQEAKVGTNYMDSVAANIKKKIRKLNVWNINHIPREGNELAHKLAQKAKMSVVTQDWYGDEAVNRVKEFLNSI